MSYQDAILLEARLRILRELAGQVDGRINEIALVYMLDAIGIRRSRDWVRTQLRALEELGAVGVADVGGTMVASLTRLGRDHVERRAIVEGVARPVED